MDLLEDHRRKQAKY